MIVDSHIHVISADHTRYPLSPLGPGRQSEWVRARPATVDQLIVAMDSAHIDRVVLVHSTSAYGYENGYEADCAARFPDRFVAVGGIDAGAPDAPATINYWIRERGLAGLRIYAAGNAMLDDDATFLDDPANFPAWETFAELGIPLVVQIRFPALPRLARLLERFPTVPVILDNLAMPPLDDGPPYAAAGSLFALARHPQLFMKITSILLHRGFRGGRGDFGSFFAKVVAEYGAERVMWGSNFPGSEGTPGELLALARRECAGLDAAAQRAIFGETALRLYPALTRAASNKPS
jgi:L-fuconolactonase